MFTTLALIALAVSLIAAVSPPNPVG